MYGIEESLRARLDALERRISDRGHPVDIENLTASVDDEMRATETRLMDRMSKLQQQFESRLGTVERSILEQQGDF